jgi:iron complex outermembrane receptor protein
MAGVEYRNHIRQDLLNYDQDPYFLYLDERRSTWDGAVYVQDEYSISSKWTLDLGLRYDRYEATGGTTNPRAAVIYAPSPKTTLKVLYGEAFRAPNAYELFYPQGASTYKPNPGLRPESVRTAEIVLERYWRNARLAGSAYRSAMSDLVSLMTDPGDGLLFFANDRGTRTLGAEIELDWKWKGGKSLRFSHAWQSSEDLLTDTILVNSPKNLAKLNLILPLPGRALRVAVEMQYASRRKTLLGDGAPAFWVTNLNVVSRDLPGGLVISVGAFNLFDREYAEPGSEEHLQDAIPQNGRNLRAHVTWRF